MESTTSISKGVFAFKNGFKPEKRRAKTKKTTQRVNINEDKLWYDSFRKTWTNIETKIKKINNKIFSEILENLLVTLKNCYNKPVNEIPALALLTGINTPDNVEQFSTLSDEIKSDITPHVATLDAQDCNSVKALVENVVRQFVDEENEDDCDSDEDDARRRIKKNQCTFTYLQSWYREKYSTPNNKRQKIDRKLLVVIFPEFESFQESVIQDFILICSSCLNTLPIVLVFGVATSLSVLHKTFSYQTSSRLFIHAFNSCPSTEHLNNILDRVILSERNPFHLGGKAFALFIDVFLFYDFSVKGFVQNFKFTMLQHYSQTNAMALCVDCDKTDAILDSFAPEDLESVRRLASFRSYVENSPDPQLRIDLLENDEYLTSVLRNELRDFHSYLHCFHGLLRCLALLVTDLPRGPLGKQLREIYAVAVNKNVTDTDEYRECTQLLSFLSKEQLVEKMGKMCDVLRNFIKYSSTKELKDVLQMLITHMVEIREADYSFDEVENEQPQLEEKLDRAGLKQKLLDMTKKTKTQNRYEKSREKFLNELSKIFTKYLKAPHSRPFHEIFFFNDIVSIRNHIVGSHRAAIHTALNNPHHYLQCNCCVLTNDASILPTMPDMCIIYKLHLECGKLINMYDWLQAFVTIVDPNRDREEDERTVDPKLQARFTRGVAELEFLGFIKSSKKKTDHVLRLTWGG